MRLPKFAPLRHTVVYFTIRRFANGKYGRFPFHRHESLEVPLKRTAKVINTLKFTFQE